MLVGGWFQVSLGKKIIGKSSQNSPIPYTSTDIFKEYTMCILFEQYTSPKSDSFKSDLRSTRTEF